MGHGTARLRTVRSAAAPCRATTHKNKYEQKLKCERFCRFVNNVSNGQINMRVDETFDCNDDYIEKISVMSRDRMAVAFSSGKIVIREVKKTGRNTCSCLDKLAIPCPESLKEELDQEFDEVDTDEPSLCSSRNGKKILQRRRMLYFLVLFFGSIGFGSNAKASVFHVRKLACFHSVHKVNVESP